MHKLKLAGAFFLGALMTLAATVAVTAQAKAPGTPRWDVMEVDAGAVRADLNKTGDYSKADPEFNRQVRNALSRGYEPFAASVYNNGSLANEKCYFFRKRIQ